MIHAFLKRWKHTPQPERTVEAAGRVWEQYPRGCWHPTTGAPICRTYQSVLREHADHEVLQLLGKVGTAIELVLLDHRKQISGDYPSLVDPNLSELAYVYRQITGWTVEDEPEPACPPVGDPDLPQVSDSHPTTPTQEVE